MFLVFDMQGESIQRWKKLWKEEVYIMQILKWPMFFISKITLKCKERAYIECRHQWLRLLTQKFDAQMKREGPYLYKLK